MHIIFFIAMHYNIFKISNISCGFDTHTHIGVANGPAEPARMPTKYPAGPENVLAGPVKTDRSPWQALIGATGYAPTHTKILAF